MKPGSSILRATSGRRKNVWSFFAIVSLLVYMAAVLAGSAKLIALGKISGLIVFLTYALMFCAVCFFAVRVFYIDRRDTLLGKGSPKKLAFIMLMSVVAGCILEALTLIGAPLSSPFVLSDWGIKRFVIFSAAVFTGLVLVVSQPMHRRIRKNDAILLNRSKRTYRVFAILAILSVSISVAASGLLNLELFPCLIFGVALAIPITTLVVSERIVEMPQWVFISIALPVGLVICTQVPPMTGVSWDDQIHYRNALNLSYLTSPEITDTEIWMSEMAVRRAQGEDVGVDIDSWGIDDVRAYKNETNDLYSEDVNASLVQRQYNPDQLLSFSSLGYIPSAIGLWVGRLLHLPFLSSLVLGRIANLVSYCIVCFLAVKITPVKKITFTVLALIPTNIFLAANYSYDPWLTSMILLGSAMLFREMWGNDGHLDFAYVFISALIMFSGLAVKAVYFPVIGLFFLMPKYKFMSASQRGKYYLFVLCFGLFVLASFAVPFLFGVGAGTEVGDMRGGTGISSPDQLRFILNNPFEYIGILTRFLVENYFNPIFSYRYLFTFAYLSNGSPFDAIGLSFSNPAVNLIPVIFIAVVAFFDNEDGEAWRFAGKGSTLWASLVYLLTYVLVATALYISFTPVGYDTVNGCQFRYQLPIMAPMLATILNYGKPLGFRDETKKVIYCAAFACLAFWVFAFVVSKWTV